jgi:pimeloyl-ACP methyl ester carboxylesterase
MKRIRPILVIIGVVLALLVVGFVAYTRLFTAGPEQTALDALASDELVEVQSGDWLVFSPAGTTPRTGLIFYPGALVDPRAYAPAAREIAAAGYLTVIPTMPLNMAVFDADQAADIVDAFPEIEHWAVGGHSLGGAMAAQFADGNPGALDGLVLWGAYPGQNIDLSGSEIQVVSIYGDRDGVSESETVEASRPRLPTGTEWLLIEGGNHAQFGWYGPQRGDQAPQIDHLEQQAMTVAATVRLLGGITP